MHVHTRFAPSPTGYLHIGALRTALFSYLFAKHHHGKFSVRIEDTDQKRYVRGADTNLLNILKRFGLQWDNNVIIYQSQRIAHYKNHAFNLIEKGAAYFCFCTEERLNELRERQKANKQKPGYDGFCRNIHPQEAKKMSEEKPFVIRLKMPKTGRYIFHDLVRGRIEFSLSNEEDPIIIKSDGYPTYHLAHIVDDHDMQITHVIRGEEWLPSIPKHFFLWEAFGWEMPQYAHLSLILNTDKTKLSKRKGDVSVENYLEKGYLEEAILNFILLLGWNPGDNREIFSLSEMIQEFSLDKITPSPAIFNIQKLDWINGVYIRNLPLEELVERCMPYLIQSGLIHESEKKQKADFIRRVVALEQPRLKKLSDLPKLADYFFLAANYHVELLRWKNTSLKTLKENLQRLKDLLLDFPENEFQKTILEKRIFDFIQKNHLTNGEVLWPFRVALSGKSKSPGPFEIAEILGKKLTCERLEKAIEKIQHYYDKRKRD